MSIAKISIYLAKNRGCDDEITIVQMWHEYKIIYLDGDIKRKHFIYASENEVIAYVDDLFNLLKDDLIDPFKSIQFTFPCFPSVLYTIRDLNKNDLRQGVRDRLISVLRNWPECIVPETATGNAAAAAAGPANAPFAATVPGPANSLASPVVPIVARIQFGDTSYDFDLVI